MGELLGEGAFGAVFAACYSGQDVAIKLLTGSQALASRLSLESHFIRRLRHPFVVDCLGVCSDPEGRDANGALIGLAVVMQRARHGSVLEVMRDPERRQMLCSRGQWLLFLSQAASGYGHLHSRSLLHRDIKPSNLLVTEQARPLVADFGLACAAGNAEACGQGTIMYMAPELLEHGVTSVQSDMYSYAGVMWFLASAAEDSSHQSEPWDGMASQDIEDCVIAGERPIWPKKVQILSALERFRAVSPVLPCALFLHMHLLLPLYPPS